MRVLRRGKINPHLLSINFWSCVDFIVVYLGWWEPWISEHFLLEFVSLPSQFQNTKLNSIVRPNLLLPYRYDKLTAAMLSVRNSFLTLNGCYLYVSSAYESVWLCNWTGSWWKTCSNSFNANRGEHLKNPDCYVCLR